MFAPFSLTPKYQSIIKQIYYKEEGDDQKISLLIHYIKSKPERIKKVFSYLKEKCRKEFEISQSVKITCKIITSVIEELSEYSIYFETEILKIFLIIFGEILQIKSTKTSQVVYSHEFLNLFEYFFKTLQLKTYKSEKYINMIIRIITRELENIEIKAKYNEIDFCSDQNEPLTIKNTGEEYTDVNQYLNSENNSEKYGDSITPTIHTLSHSGSNYSKSSSYEEKYKQSEDIIEYDYNSEESSESSESSTSEISFDYQSAGCVPSKSDVNNDLYFLKFLSAIIITKDFFIANYREKYQNIVNCLFKKDKLNISERNEILSHMARACNILNSSCFIYLVLDYSSRLKLDLINDILLTNLQKATHPHIVIESNQIFMEEIEKVKAINYSLEEIQNIPSVTYQSQLHILLKHSSLLVKEDYISNSNPLRLARSFFYLLKYLYEQETENSLKNEFTLKGSEIVKDLEYFNYSAILEYLNLFFLACFSISDVLCFFMKKAFQFEFYERNSLMTIYTRRFQKMILDRILFYFETKTKFCSPIVRIDIDFISILSRISTIPCFNVLCTKIFFIVLKNNFLSCGRKDKQMVLSKMRVVYYESKYEEALEILIQSILERVNKKDEINVRQSLEMETDEFTTWCMLNTLKENLKIYIFRIWNCKEIDDPENFILKKYQKEKFDSFDVSVEQKKYNEYFGWNKRVYTNSMKSSINLEGLNAKRKSFIKIVK
ncbi:hypothetical protein CWI38_0472p0030 [Hamiltosporidium tvaerminnensis]|uniref:Uncharacterized protein n=1 Tax=Hamiltosporidium tvaerminnensis TaxID=1176355 RepID=A0A4Q9LX09_9MICR|nr:hypothetical protein CWI38_0472p0030 [Hamiltosporidium tvaerminnensis]